MNRRQTQVLLWTGVLCTIAFLLGFPRNFSTPDDYAFNLLAQYLVNLMKTLPPILLAGGIFFYFLRDRKEPIRSSRRKVLVIDDENDTCLMVKRNLELGGDYDVKTAHNGGEGISAALRGSPDLILLDIIMPGMSGFDVLKKLKKTRRTASIPVIMLTAVGTEEAQRKAASLYNEDYLVKPVRTDTLKAKIEEVLKRSM